MDSWNIDAHSHSYLTLEELLDYDWHQRRTSVGDVSENVYKEYKNKGIDSFMLERAFGGNVVLVEPNEMDEILEGERPRKEGANYRVTYKTIETYAKLAGNFFTKSIPALESLSESKKKDDVRIVFCFDN